MKTNDQVILEEILKQQKSELSEPMKDSDYFELFTASQILKDYDLSWEEIESGIVGDGGDGGIDGFFMFLNGELIREDTEIPSGQREISIELHIIQSKTTSGFSESAIQKLRTTSENILDLSNNLDNYKGVYNEQLLSAVGRFRDIYRKFASKIPNLSISYYYATQGAEVHTNVERQVVPLKKTISALFSSANFSFDFLGARELLHLTRKKPKTSYQIRLSDSPISTENNAYVCLVRLEDYYAFITDETGKYIKSIFDANVRDHQGNVQVNKGIRDTLENPKGEDFWWLNNGITILAEQAVLSGKTLTLESPRVVNGLQTSVEIFRYFKNKNLIRLLRKAHAIKSGEDTEFNDPPDERRLLVRVIVPEESNSYERIIRATNSQTSIPIASLRATDKVHRDIEDFFKGHGLYYDRRKNQYKNEGKPLDRIVSISYVAQSVISIVLGQPDDARARPSTLLKDDAEYLRVFSEDYPTSIYLISTLIMKRVENFLRLGDFGYTKKDINNIKYYVAMFATWLMLNSTSPHPNDIANLEVDSFDESILEQAREEVWSIYQRLGGDDQVAKGTELIKEIKKRLVDLTFTGRVSPSP